MAKIGADRLKIRVRTGDVSRVIIMNLGTFDEKSRSWKLELKEEFLVKLLETFSTPDARATGVDIILEKD